MLTEFSKGKHLEFLNHQGIKLSKYKMTLNH